MHIYSKKAWQTVKLRISSRMPVLVQQAVKAGLTNYSPGYPPGSHFLCAQVHKESHAHPKVKRGLQHP